MKLKLQIDKQRAILAFAMTFAIVFAAAGTIGAVASIGASEYGIFALVMIILAGTLIQIAMAYKAKEANSPEKINVVAIKAEIEEYLNKVITMQNDWMQEVNDQLEKLEARETITPAPQAIGLDPDYTIAPENIGGVLIDDLSTIATTPIPPVEKAKKKTAQPKPRGRKAKKIIE